MTLKESLSEFVKALEPTEQEQKAVQQVYGPLIKALMKPLALLPEKQAFLAGSWGRGTAITPLHDVDLFAVLSTTAERAQQKHRPSEILTQVERVLRELYPGARLKRQRRSIQLSGVAPGFPALGFDVVPAFRNPTDKERYHIPDDREDTWIRTNPELHKKRLTAALPLVLPLIKVIKRWARHQRHPLRSFYLETMCVDALQVRPASQLDGLRAMFEGLATVVRAPVQDPAKLGPQLDQGATVEERKAKEALFRAAAAEVQLAQSEEARGRPDLAHARMRALLGSDWRA